MRLNRGVSLRLQQLYAVFVKRLIISYRSPLMSLVQLFIPIIFTALGCIVQYSIPGAKDSPPLTLRFAYYDDPVVAYVGECTRATYVKLSPVANVINSVEHICIIFLYIPCTCKLH